MKAVQYDRHGGPEVLRLVEVPEPHAGPGQVRIAVRAVGVNAWDWKVRSGAFPGMPASFPASLGNDAAGVVDEIGDGVTGVSVGDAVFGFTTGAGYAELTVLASFAHKPAALPWAEAAGLPTAAETSYRALAALDVEAGQTLLVSGAAGGVGQVAVQVARVRGARVIGTAGPDNLDFVRSLGADPVRYGDGLVARVRELAPDGVDRVLDVAGRGALSDLVELAGGAERVLTIAHPDAQRYGVRFSSGGAGRAVHALDEAAKLIEEGRLTTVVERTFPLGRADEAHRLSEQGHARGKLILIPG